MRVTSPRVRGSRRRRAARALAVAALIAGVVGAGCGESIELPDLFEIQRSGGTAVARLTLVVNEGGAVYCNRGSKRQLNDAQLVLARGLQEELQSPSEKHLALAPRPGSVFSYSVSDARGTVRFSDNSAGQPPVLRHLAYFVLEVAQKVCRLPE